MAPSSIDVVLRMRNAKRFQSDASKSGKSVENIGRGGRRAGKDLDKLERKTKRLHRGFAGLGKGAKLGFAAIGGAAALGAAKSAIGATTDLTKRTILLQRMTKMDANEATRWAAVTKVRGIETKALGMSFAVLSKNMTGALDGSKAQAKAFADLGISQKELVAAGGDVGKLFPMISDGYRDNANKAERNAAMTKLLGRGWQGLTPMLADGAKGLDENLKMADKYGVTLSGKPLKSQKDLIKVQREMAMAQLGWQVQFSTQIAPHLVKAFKMILGASQSLRGVFKWAENHPGITRTAVAMLALGKAIQFLPGGGFISKKILAGTGSIAGKLGKRLAGPVKRTLMRVLGRGGDAAGARAGDALVNSTGSMFATRSKKLDKTIGGRMGRIGKRAGGAAGKAAGLAFVAGAVIGLAGLGSAVTEVLRAVNGKVDKWAREKFGAAGSFYSDVKSFIGDNYPAGLPGAEGVEQLLGTRRSKIKGYGPGVKRGAPGHRRHGGPMRAGMSAIVGEAGPELLSARPTGGFVSASLGGGPIAVPELSAGGGFEIHVHNQLAVDGEVLARSVTRHRRLLSEAVERNVRSRRARE